MPIYLIFIILSFLASVVGLILVKENRQRALYLFSFFLLTSSIAEYIGSSMSANNYNNISFYNFFTLYEFIFYLYFLRSIFTSQLMKKILAYVITGYLLLTLCNIIFVQGLNTFHSHTYVLGCTLIVLFSIIYFYRLFRFPETGGLTKNPFFWIVIALMFYYTCTFSIFGLENFITESMGYYYRLLFIITDLLNGLLYSLYIIGFLCQINLRKLLRLS